MAWLKEEGFGGIMIWSIDMDDFRGSCGTGKYPLISAMKQELEGYKVKLEFDGPFENYNPSGQYTTKDRKFNFECVNLKIRNEAVKTRNIGDNIETYSS